ncbi:MAG: helix-turn-helix transcriptional regulator [Archangiaceae bacterium]|nr:helix-turn-helix transcriptional regulator [Archangiaceae bacterium]
MLRVGLDRLLDPRAGRMWSGADLMLWHPTRGVLGATLPRLITTDTLLPVASTLERLLRERRTPKTLVLDVSRVLPQGCDDAALASFRRFVVEPLAQHPARIARAVVVGRPSLSSSALVGCVTLARLPFAVHAHERIEAALEQLDVPVSELLGAIASELAPLGLVSRVRALIGEDVDLGLRDVAMRLSVAPRSLQRALAAAGTSYAYERLDVRLELAASRLMRTSQKVSAIARESGYASLAHFLTVFKHRFGLSPAAFRARHQGGG